MKVDAEVIMWVLYRGTAPCAVVYGTTKEEALAVYPWGKDDGSRAVPALTAPWPDLQRVHVLLACEVALHQIGAMQAMEAAQAAATGQARPGSRILRPH